MNVTPTSSTSRPSTAQGAPLSAVESLEAARARVEDLERTLVRQSEDSKRLIRSLGLKNVELVNTVAAQTANLARPRQDFGEATFRTSKSYRVGLRIADLLRVLRTLKRRLRRGADNPLFDLAWYLRANPDVRWSGVDAYAHYLKFGTIEGRKPNSEFDGSWYLRTYPDVAASGVDPLVHYFDHGAAEGRNPSPSFDTKKYAEAHPEISGQNPLLHYLRTRQPEIAQRRNWRGDGILVVSRHCPSRAHAGGLRLLDLYATIRSLDPNIEIDLFTHRQPDVDWSYDDLPAIFSHVYFADGNDLSLTALERKTGTGLKYRLVDIQFHQPEADVLGYRKITKRLIFTPMELLSREFALQADSPNPVGDPFVLKNQRDTARKELELCGRADNVVCVSEPDAAFLRNATGLTNVVALETGVSLLEFGELIDEDDDEVREPIVVFVAYFGSATNLAALEWYLREVHPLVRAAVLGYRFEVVGRGTLPRHLGDDDPSIDIVGEVSSVGPFIKRAAVGIAPALGGAGFRGKINQYSLLGLPTVASPIAAEGMAYRNGVDIIVASTASEFAQGCIVLLKDAGRRRELAARARKTCIDRYSWAVKEAQVRDIYGLPSGDEAKAAEA